MEHDQSQSNSDETQIFESAENDFDELVPSMIGRYRVQNLIGKGGFGMVYLAKDEKLDRLVAIKVPHPRLISRPDYTQVYLEEARNVAKLDHPNIVPVYDVGNTEKYPCFIVSKYIDGSDLAARFREARPGVLEACELIVVIANALHFAHKQGLVHRDIKPGNILLDKNGIPYVVDFGLALSEERHYDFPRIVGTPAYMSPEQIRGESHRVDGRSDIFSLGIVFYEMLTGRRPFRGPSEDELFEQITGFDPWPLRQHDERLPRELERICLKALAKRARHRYSSAFDFAEDVQMFLDQPKVRKQLDEEISETRDRGEELHSESTAGQSVTAEDSDSGFKSSNNSTPVRIIPKGLRAFDTHDADFFLKLLPGPRDREGIPDSIRFWKLRIEENEYEKCFPVGVIYGPSGCGKSSFVRAGLLPRLPDQVVAVYTEATPKETESRLLNGIRHQLPETDPEKGLVETIAALRRGEGKGPHSKVLLVIDQFEQWLHGNGNDAENEMVRALRQCDGIHVQCLLLVRDDFWLAVSRLMRELEIQLVEGNNIGLVDLFDKKHAKRVLTAFGRAFDRLPDEDDQLSKPQVEFLDRAVDELAQDDKIICVRLALFAEMMKGKTWEASTLQQSGGISGVGVTFLEETFSASTASPDHRYHEKAIRAVLQELLPSASSNIKGQMKSVEKLQTASGYENSRDFHGLLRILDSEVRLITPTDPEGTDAQCEETDGSRNYEYYQLTHDYLVPSLRSWLTRKQKETRHGRAMLRIADLAEAWSSNPENRFLPTLWESLYIRFNTQPVDWSESQKKMMRKSVRYHGFRIGSLVTVLLAIGLISNLIWSSYASKQNQIRQETRANALVGGLLNADVSLVNGLVEEIDHYREWSNPLLYSHFRNERDGSAAKLNAAIALAADDEEMVNYIRDQLLISPIEQFKAVRPVMVDHEEKVSAFFWKTGVDEEAAPQVRFQALAVLAGMPNDDSRWATSAPFIVGHLCNDIPAIQLDEWLKQFEPVKDVLIPSLKRVFENRLVGTNANDRQLARASLILSEYLAGKNAELIELVLIADQLDEFRPLINAIDNRDPVVLEKLQTVVDAKLPRYAAEVRDPHWKRQALAIVSLLELDFKFDLKALFAGSEDNSLRSYVIHFLGRLQVAPAKLLNLLKGTSDPAVQRSLILAIGGQDPKTMPTLVSREFRDLSAQFIAHENPGIHGAAKWVMRRWKLNIPELNKKYTSITDQERQKLLAYEVEIKNIQRQIETAKTEALANADKWEKDLQLTVNEVSDELTRDLAIHYSLDEVANGQTGNSTNPSDVATILGDGKAQVVDGVIGNAIQIENQPYAANGTCIRGGAGFNPDGTDSFSYGCWLWVDGEELAASVISKMDRDKGARGFDLWYANGNIGAHVKNRWPDRWLKAYTDTIVQPREWNHLFVTYDGSQSTAGLCVYLNGELVRCDTMADTLEGTIQNDVPFQIGGRGTSVSGSMSNAFSLRGRVDDVRVYSRKLAGQEIKLLYRFSIGQLSNVPVAERTVLQKSLLTRVLFESNVKINRLKAQLEATKLAARDVLWKKENRWFQNSQGQTMVVIPAPVSKNRLGIQHTYAISSTEITEEHFQKYTTHDYDKSIAPSMDCPVHQVSWLDAAAYCNWLSKTENIPPDQWCYESFVMKDGPNPEKAFKQLRLKTNFRDLEGYRLPTMEEWKYAAAASTKTTYHFGEPLGLLKNYGWYGETSKGRTYPVGLLMPNDNGLFDMQGNLWEWIQRIEPGKEGFVTIVGEDSQPILGGCYRYIPLHDRSEDSFTNLADNRTHHIGFRVVRTLPKPE